MASDPGELRAWAVWPNSDLIKTRIDLVSILALLVHERKANQTKRMAMNASPFRSRSRASF